MTLTVENTSTNESLYKCQAFCPVCGTDLSYDGYDNECICKSKECSWTCENCKH